MIRVRPYEADDRTFVLSLAPRLLIGMPSWRDPHLWLTAFQKILALSTGAANARALGFYHHLGFRDEDVKLVKVLEEPGEVTTDRRT